MHLCPCIWLLQFCLDAVVLNILLIARFDHRSRRSAATDDRSPAVGVVHIELLLRGSSGLALCSVAFGVSFWCFPCRLLNLYRSPVTGVVPPCGHGRHGWCRAHFVPRSMPLVMSVGAHSLSERIGAFILTGDLAVVKISPISVIVAVVKRGRLGMIGGTRVSVTQRSK